WDYMHSYPDGMGWGWFGIPLMLLFWGVLIFAVIMLVRIWGRGRSGGSEGNRAIEILRERYARGEISLEEYEERKRNLEK
ncbi:MAG TPA: SHOCT domain-containing protein, partial [Gammaproteobacteria bacterium]